MASSNNIEIVEDDERIFRRIPFHYYDVQNNEFDNEAFKPRKDDITGISVDRARSQQHTEFKTIEEAARSPSQKKQYYVAVFSVLDLSEAGLDVVSEHSDDHPGHAVIPNLKYQDRNTTEAINWMQLLATELCLEVAGPFPPVIG